MPCTTHKVACGLCTSGAQVIDLLTQLHACESERRECQGIVDTELLGLDQLKAAIQVR